jgi:hypothetical protein
MVDSSQLSSKGGSLTPQSQFLPIMSDDLKLETQEEATQAVDSLNIQVPYVPRSQGFRLETLTPAAAMKQLEIVFDRIEAVTGMTVDEYVRDRLREPDQASMFSHYSAEQIDSLALAIYNYEYDQKGTLIGHDTGIGKTRIDCGLMRYAKNQNLIPVVVTADALLFKDLIGRDAADTGNQFNPLLTGNNQKVPITNELGEEVDTLSTPITHNKKIREFATQGSIGGHDCVLTTYSQLSGKPSTDRRELLESIADRTFLILDESHKAGGPAGNPQNKTRAKLAKEEQERRAGTYVGSCTEFFQDLVTKTPGFVALSATAIKDPIVASRLFFETTDLKYSAENQESFTRQVKEGGAPLQQYLFDLWTQSGGCIRCEKSYEGIEFGTQSVEVDLERADGNVKILKLINDFDRFKNGSLADLETDLRSEGEKLLPPGAEVSEGGVQSTNFTSILHSLQAVSALALKAEQTAQEAIAAIENGQKPVIMLFNTVESAIERYIDEYNKDAVENNLATDDPAEQIKPLERGDALALNAGHLFMRYLEKSREIRIQGVYSNDEGKSVTVRRRLTDEELGEVGMMLYDKAKKAIEDADWSKMPVSPIDYMKSIIKEAGYEVGEITGRTKILEYGSQEDLQAGVVTYNIRNSNPSQKLQVMSDFQNGRCDAIITNSTTGYSLHASKAVADQRQRVMLLVQPHLDINQVVQSIGRTHRSGQINPAVDQPDTYDANGNPQYGKFPGKFGLPEFKLMVGKDLPTEERPVAVLANKMRFLNANTTGNTKSNFQIGGADFMNRYGAEVAYRMVATDPVLHRDLGSPLGDIADPENDKAAPTVDALKRITGRVVMLASEQQATPENPYPSLSRQAQFYDTLNSDFRDLLEQKIALGENALEAQSLDIKAKPVSRTILAANDPSIDSPFASSTYLVEVTAETGTKPLKTLQVVNAVRVGVEYEPIASLDDFDEMEDSYLRRAGVDKSMEMLGELAREVDIFKEKHFSTQQNKVTISEGRVAKWSQRIFEAESERASAEDTLLNLDDVYSSQREALGTDETALENLQKEQEREQKVLEGKIASLNTKIPTLQASLDKATKDVEKQTAVAKRDRKNLDNSVVKTSKLIEEYPIGQPVLLTNNDTGVRMYGVVSNVSRRAQSYNPASVDAWKLTIKVVDGSQQINLKFSEIGNGSNRTSVTPVEIAPSYRNSSEEISVYNLFDERQTQSRETRYLVTGQVMKSNLSGKFAKVTDSEGEIHSAYILPRSFDPEMLNAQHVQLKTSEQVQQFFRATLGQGLVENVKGTLTIRDAISSGEGSLELLTSRGDKGKAIFGDTALIELTGEFVSITERGKNLMICSVPAEKASQVLDYLLSTSDLIAMDNNAIARGVMGIEDVKWEPCSDKGLTPDDFVQATKLRQPLVKVINEAELAELKAAEAELVAAVESPQFTNPLSQNRMPKVDRAEAFVLPPSKQYGEAEKNVAELLKDAGLSQILLQGEDFYLKVENEPWIPLVLERQGEDLILTHYLKDAADELYIDAEMVFELIPADDGIRLNLRETATAFMGGEARKYGTGADKSFAELFSNNLIAQGFSEAARQKWLAERRADLEDKILVSNCFQDPTKYLVYPEGDRLQAMVADGLIDRDKNTVTLNVGDRSGDELKAIAAAIKPALNAYVPDVRKLEVINQENEVFSVRLSEPRNTVQAIAPVADEQLTSGTSENTGDRQSEPVKDAIAPEQRPKVELVITPIFDPSKTEIIEVGGQRADVVPMSEASQDSPVEPKIENTSSQAGQFQDTQMGSRSGHDEQSMAGTPENTGDRQSDPAKDAIEPEPQFAPPIRSVPPIQSERAAAIRIEPETTASDNPVSSQSVTAAQSPDPRIASQNPLLETFQTSADLIGIPLDQFIDSFMKKVDVPVEQHALMLEKMGDRIDEIVSEQQVPVGQAVNVLLDEIKSKSFNPTLETQPQAETRENPGKDTSEIPKPQVLKKPQIWDQIPDEIKNTFGTSQIRQFFAQPDPVQAIAAFQQQNPIFGDSCEKLTQIYQEQQSGTVSKPLEQKPLETEGRAEDKHQEPITKPPELPLKSVADTINRNDSSPQLSEPQPNPTGYSPSLNELRKWFADAKAIGQSEEYLNQIKTIGVQMKAAVPASNSDPNVKSSDFQISDQMRSNMERDGQTALSIGVDKQARQILWMMGTNQYQGKTYGLTVDESQTLTVTAAGRGVILQSHQQEVLSSSLTPGDAAIFEKHLSNLHHQQQQGSQQKGTGFNR